MFWVRLEVRWERKERGEGCRVLDCAEPGYGSLIFMNTSFIHKFLKGKESLFNELLWRKLSKGEKKRNTVSSLLPRLMTCITPTIVLFRQPSSLANIKFVCSHMVELLLFFIHAAGILWGNMMGQEEEGRRGQPSPKCGRCAFPALHWLHSGKLMGIGGGSHANEVRVGSSVAFLFFRALWKCGCAC